MRQPYLLNLVLNFNAVRQQNVQNKFNLSNGLPVLDLREVTGKDELWINTFSFLDGGSLPTDIALLKSLAEKFTGCSYFEIGTWRGESVANVAETAEKCYTLNLSREELLDRGLSEKYADLHGFFSKGLTNVTHLEGDSRSFDYAGLNQKFDLIFIDGDHHYEAVKTDTKNVFKHLVHKNSVVVWHDYAFNPEHVRFEVLEAILDGVPDDIRTHLYHVSNTMCAVYLPHHNLTSSVLDYPTIPNRRFSLRIQTGDIQRQS